MALIKCDECSKEISTDATTCPNCGAKQPKKTSLITWVIALFFCVVLFNMVSRSGESPSNVEQAPPSNDITRNEALSSCMGFVKKMLHDPDSANFTDTDEASVSLKENRAFVLRGVRAKNAFGAMRLSEFACFVEKKNGTATAILVTEKGSNGEKMQKLWKDWGF